MKNNRTVTIVAVLFLFGGAGIAAAEPPNILFIILDDVSRASIGAYGSSDIKTPGFDRIAEEGVRFTNAYACNPKCSPARACLLTGRYSWQLEEACNHWPILSPKWKFYPALLEEVGYSVGYTGKGWAPGEFSGTVNPAGSEWNDQRTAPPYNKMSDKDYTANFEAFLDSVPEDQPFCFWFGTHEAHRGYTGSSWKLEGRDLSAVTVPGYFPDTPAIRKDLANYAVEVEWADQHIVRTLELLEKRGLLESTLIIATSDHGMPFPRVKGQIYEDAFHVPFVARWDKKIKPGRTVTDFITFPDLAPTLMEAAGIPADPQMTGASFLPQLLSDQSGRIDPERNYTLLGKERHDIGRTDGDALSVGYPVRAIRTENYLYVYNYKPDRWPAGDPEFRFKNCDGGPTKDFIIKLGESDDPEDQHFYQLSFGKRPQEELYDMTRDTDCLNNLAANPEYADVVARLRTQMENDLRAQQDPRVLGEGDIFDAYPFGNRSMERKMYKRPDWDPVKLFNEKYGNKSGE